MPVTSIARTLLRFQYSLVRSPLTALDARVLTRLPDTSRVKVTLTRSLAGIDAAAGRLMHDPQLERRSDAVSERLERTEQSVRSAARADALRAKATQTKQDAAVQSSSRRTEAARVERERIAAALREEQQVQRQVGELADADAAEQKRQAELRAKHQQAEQAEQRRAKERQIAADQANRTAPAKKQLAAAAKTKTVARARRAKADKLDELAGTEKVTRRTTRSGS